MCGGGEGGVIFLGRKSYLYADLLFQILAKATDDERQNWARGKVGVQSRFKYEIFIKRKVICSFFSGRLVFFAFVSEKSGTPRAAYRVVSGRGVRVRVCEVKSVVSIIRFEALYMSIPPAHTLIGRFISSTHMQK